MRSPRAGRERSLAECERSLPRTESAPRCAGTALREIEGVSCGRMSDTPAGLTSARGGISISAPVDKLIQDLKYHDRLETLALAGDTGEHLHGPRRSASRRVVPDAAHHRTARNAATTSRSRSLASWHNPWSCRSTGRCTTIRPTYPDGVPANNAQECPRRVHDWRLLRGSACHRGYVIPADTQPTRLPRACSGAGPWMMRMWVVGRLTRITTPKIFLNAYP